MSHSPQGLRIHEFLQKELGIPQGAQSVKVEYEVGGLFKVSLDYLPQRSDDELEVTTLGSAAREFVSAGVGS